MIGWIEDIIVFTVLYYFFGLWIAIGASIVIIIIAVNPPTEKETAK